LLSQGDRYGHLILLKAAQFLSPLLYASSGNLCLVSAYKAKKSVYTQQVVPGVKYKKLVNRNMWMYL